MKLYGEFDEKGYHVQAFIPTNANEPQCWVVKVTKNEEPIKEITIPMNIAPRWGPDHNDVLLLEEETGKLLQSLP